MGTSIAITVMRKNKMAESKKFFRQKKGMWIYVFDHETNRSKKMELQLLLNYLNTSTLTSKRFFVLKDELKKYKKEQKGKK